MRYPLRLSAPARGYSSLPSVSSVVRIFFLLVLVRGKNSSFFIRFPVGGPYGLSFDFLCIFHIGKTKKN